MKKMVLIGLLLATITLVAACTSTGNQASNQAANSQATSTAPAADNQAADSQASTTLDGAFDWKDQELLDVNTNKNYKISDFKGKKVLLETFAVWCPTCTKQQEQIKLFHEEPGSKDVISISLDIDPNEDVEKIKQHTRVNGFEWTYSIPPTDMTQALIDEFGVDIVNTVTAPTILICEDQSTRLLPRGIKTPQKLTDEIAKGCGA